EGSSSFVGFTESVAVRAFDIEVATLLGQDIEHRGPAELGGLAHDVQILSGQLASTFSVDGQCAACPFVSSSGGANFCFGGHLGCGETSCRPCSFTLCLRHLTLVLIA